MVFKQQGLVISLDGGKGLNADTISYDKITQILEMGPTAFYLKTAKFSLAFFFKGIENTRSEFLETLKKLHEGNSLEKEKIRPFDITVHFDGFQIKSMRSGYSFNFEMLEDYVKKKKLAKNKSKEE